MPHVVLQQRSPRSLPVPLTHPGLAAVWVMASGATLASNTSPSSTRGVTWRCLWRDPWRGFWLTCVGMAGASHHGAS
eukprot:1748220-Pyramimonas_sp.AAC.1